MEKLGFQSNIQFLTYINENNNLSFIKSDLQQKENANTEDQYQIIANCLQLFIKIKDIAIFVKGKSFTFQTMNLFKNVYQLARDRFVQVYRSKDAMKKQKILYSKFDCASSQMLKAIEDRSFYDALILQKEKLSQRKSILFQQQICISLLIEAYLQLNCYADGNKFPREWRYEIIITECDYWRISLANANYFCLNAIFRVKSYLIAKKKVLKNILQDKAQSKEIIREILLFFIWTTKEQKDIFQIIKQNQKLIHEQIFKLHTLTKGIIFSQQNLDNNYQQFRSLAKRISSQTQKILLGKELKTKDDFRSEYQVVKNRYLSISLSIRDLFPYYQMEINENEIIIVLEDFLALLKKELQKLQTEIK